MVDVARPLPFDNVAGGNSDEFGVKLKILHRHDVRRCRAAADRRIADAAHHRAVGSCNLRRTAAICVVCIGDDEGVILSVAGNFCIDDSRAAAVVRKRTAGRECAVDYEVKTAGTAVDGIDGDFRRDIIGGITTADLRSGKRHGAGGSCTAIGRGDNGSDVAGRVIDIDDFYGMFESVAGEVELSGLRTGTRVGKGTAGLYRAIHQQIVAAGGRLTRGKTDLDDEAAGGRTVGNQSARHPRAAGAAVRDAVVRMHAGILQ